MAVATQLSCVIGYANLHRNSHPWGISRQLPLHKLYLNPSFTSSTDSPFRRQSTPSTITACSAANRPSPSSEIRLSREESLSNLKLRVNEKRVISASDLRGIVRLVIFADPASFISECFSRSEPYTEGLLERGVLVVPFVTDGNSSSFEFDESEEMKEITSKRKRLWQLVPVYATEWSEYLSLRMDGRVRGSGVGYPSWNAFVAHLPPAKGIWSGLLDGMDGRVL
ncbi:hypothetical protein Acr_23g0018220 [Actinidia rufa]|uniref:Uncharacterized protein n=1 Tax=Actinidia rufa TaxID=165716 RepID=A0A7J0GRK6_9ERIC|nr:hypothetical protein Acr_23g0018220 [Actinidia rufa]